MELQTTPPVLKETETSVAGVRLLERIDVNRGVPCFICAPKGYGRTTIARNYAVSRYDHEDVVWLNGEDQRIHNSIEKGIFSQLIEKHALYGNNTCGLLVIDDLPLLDREAAEQLSDSLDRILEAGRQIIITTTPLHDVFAILQSDRLLVSGRDILQSRDIDTVGTIVLLDNFFEEALPFEFSLAGLLIVLMQQGSFEDMRSLGYLIRDDVPALLDTISPLFGIDASRQRFSMCAVEAHLIKDRTESLLSKAAEPSYSMEGARGSSSFQQLIAIASLLFDHNQKRRSRELLDLAGELTLDASLATQPQAQSQLQPQPQPQQQQQPKPQPQPQSQPQPWLPQKGNIAQPTSTDASTCARAADNPPLLRIKLFGDLEISLGDTILEDSLWKRGKVRVLLIHLALNNGRGLARETIMEQLWPDMDIRHATDNFYVTWSRMCRALSGSANHCPYLVSNGMLCRIDNRFVSTDIAEFERLSKQVLFEQGSKDERIEAFLQMERLYRGELLSGCIYDDLIGAAQQRYRLLLVDAILAGSQLYSEMGHDNNALWFARKAYEIDPTREDVYRVLMYVQNRAGQRTSALQTYFACKKYLNEELGILPSQRTTALYQDLILDKR